MEKSEFLSYVKSQYAPQWVSINEQAIPNLSLGSLELVPAALPFSLSAQFNESEIKAAMRYFLGMTALQYRFWELDANGDLSRYAWNGKVGSSGLTAAFNAAWGDTMEPKRSLLLAAESLSAVEAAFGPDIPDAMSRRDVLSDVMGKRGLGTIDLIYHAIRTSGQVSVWMASIIAQRHAVAYQDPFLKKAMLFLGFVASLFRRYQIVEDHLCAYADYQIPRVLHSFGVLEYSQELVHLIRSRALIECGSEIEHAIRSATVLGCEKIAQHHKVTAAEVDWWVFLQRNKPSEPFHLTITTCY